MRKTVLVIPVLLGIFAALQAQPVHKNIVKALEKGDARDLSAFFHTHLEMDLLKKNYMVSKNQATHILQDFFQKYPPTSFDIEYEADRDNSRYAIGMLETQKGNFRINLYFLSGDRSHIIYYLSIEKIAT